jgi:hypothetical protein
MRKFGWMILGIALVLGVAACKKDPESNRVPCNNTTPTWDAQVLDIVANSCWGSNCHGTAAPAGDYTSYALIKPVLLNGKFATQVLDDRFMPQNDVLPDSILATLNCWVANGFPER